MLPLRRSADVRRWPLRENDVHRPSWVAPHLLQSRLVAPPPVRLLTSSGGPIMGRCWNAARSGFRASRRSRAV